MDIAVFRIYPCMKVRLQTYDSRSSSGVRAFAQLPGGLLVQFQDGEGYLYDGTRPGETHVAKMQALALAGRGLSTYISQHVRENYAGKFTDKEIGRLANAET